MLAPMLRAMSNPAFEISYGKAAVPVYRHGATPLVVAPIAESPFSGRANALFAAEVDVEVFGDVFWPAYTHGDNARVVATDSIKNIVLRESASWQGATLESLLDHLGRYLLASYEQMPRLRLTGRELRFDPRSAVLHERSHDDASQAMLELDRTGITAHESRRVGIELLKLTGSAFTSFVRDSATTLPERADRPLFIALDVHWRYRNVADALGGPRHVAGEQVRDLCATVFDGFVSESIQHLVHAFAERALERLPQLAEIGFAARNLTREPYADGVYSDPFNAFGTITLTMRR